VTSEVVVGGTDSTAGQTVSWWRRTWLDPVLLSLVTFGLAAYRTRTALISPYDEMYHLSYIQYLFNWHLPQIGDTLNTWAREGFSCHPVFPFGNVTGVACGKIGAPGLYPEGGTNTAAGWPPIYYGISAGVVRVLGWFGVSPFEAARLASSMFLAAGAGVLALASRRLGAGRLSTIGAVLLLVAAPVSDVLGSFVTPHSATLLLGSLCLLFVAWAVEVGRSPLRVAIVGAALGALCSLTQPHAIVGVAIAGLAIAAVSMRRAGAGSVDGRLVGASAGLVGPVVAILVYGAWTKLQDARTVPYPDGVNLGGVSKLPDDAVSILTEVLGKAWYFLPGTLTNDSLGYGLPELFVAGLLTVLAVGALGAAVFTARANPVPSALGWSALVVAPIAAIAMDIYFPFPLPLRYGFAVAPVLVALLAIVTTSRSAKWLVLVAGSGAYVMAIFSLWP